jgi:hypothetical protein
MGRADSTVYAPGIRFPIEMAPAFANSQVWGRGGSSGPGGSECDHQNFVYPWHDNFCETRTYSMPLCPASVGHQGQDVRASTCQPNVHWVVAITDGTITHIGSYTVYLTAADGTRFDYLHMDSVQVTVGQTVRRGDHVGKVSHIFGASTTTVHLHFNIQQNVAGVGTVFVPPYLSLIQAYQALLGGGPQDAGGQDTGAQDVAAQDTGTMDASVLDASTTAADAGGQTDQLDAAAIPEDDAAASSPPDAAASRASDQSSKARPSGCSCAHSQPRNESFALLSLIVMLSVRAQRAWRNRRSEPRWSPHVEIGVDCHDARGLAGAQHRDAARCGSLSDRSAARTAREANPREAS